MCWLGYGLHGQLVIALPKSYHLWKLTLLSPQIGDQPPHYKFFYAYWSNESFIMKRSTWSNYYAWLLF